MTIPSSDIFLNHTVKENLLISFNLSTLLKTLPIAVSEIYKIRKNSDRTVLLFTISLLKARPYHKNTMTQSQGSLSTKNIQSVKILP